MPRNVIRMLYYASLVLLYGFAKVMVRESLPLPAIVIVASLVLVSMYLSRLYTRERTRYIAFVGSQKAWKIAKFEQRYSKLKWIRTTADLNGEHFTHVYCTEQDNRRYKVLFDAAVLYVEHLKGRKHAK